MSTKQKVNEKCLCGSGKKYKKCCIDKPNSNVFPTHITNLEKQETPLLIEGTLRHQSNIMNAKTKYGNIFNGKIIYTKYSGDTNDVPTLVCSRDISLVLGKPRYPEKFTDNEYKIKVIDRNNSGLYSIEVSKCITQSIARHTLDELMKNITEPHCKICGDTENDGKILKISNTIQVIITSPRDWFTLLKSHIDGKINLIYEKIIDNDTMFVEYENLKEMPTQMYLCEDCYNIQLNM